jgi:hypothetical protein
MSIGAAVHVSEGLSVRVYELEAAVHGLNSPWSGESSHWQKKLNYKNVSGFNTGKVLRSLDRSYKILCSQDATRQLSLRAKTALALPNNWQANSSSFGA